MAFNFFNTITDNVSSFIDNARDTAQSTIFRSTPTSPGLSINKAVEQTSQQAPFFKSVSPFTGGVKTDVAKQVSHFETVKIPAKIDVTPIKTVETVKPIVFYPKSSTPSGFTNNKIDISKVDLTKKLPQNDLIDALDIAIGGGTGITRTPEGKLLIITPEQQRNEIDILLDTPKEPTFRETLPSLPQTPSLPSLGGVGGVNMTLLLAVAFIFFLKK